MSRKEPLAYYTQPRSPAWPSNRVLRTVHHPVDLGTTCTPCLIPLPPPSTLTSVGDPETFKVCGARRHILTDPRPASLAIQHGFKSSRTLQLKAFQSGKPRNNDGWKLQATRGNWTRQLRNGLQSLVLGQYFRRLNADLV